MWQDYISVSSLAEALEILAEKREAARIVAGATDLILEMERGVRKGITTLVDITRVAGLDQIALDEENHLHLGPLVTHNRCVASKLIVERAFPLAQAAWEVGAPQIRSRGTVAGNLITASPANDTIPPLMVLGASVVLRSKTGQRSVPLDEFYTGVRRTVLQPDEMLVDIHFPAMPVTSRGTFIKIGLRRAQAISVVNAAVLLNFEEKGVRQASIALGSVAPVIVRAPEAEACLVGQELDEALIEQAARLAQRSVRPIDDVRGSADYRLEMVRVAVLRALRFLLESGGDKSLKEVRQRANFPAAPVLLENPASRLHPAILDHTVAHLKPEPAAIVTRINGKEYTFRSGHEKTLLRLLREDAGLIGTKEGCAEGECGACTVFLDGQAVMSCLVPAPRAHAAEIVTIEGLSKDGVLHPVQQAFIDKGAVQCGYCTPGFIMSGAMLLQEQPKPTHAQVQQAITGNLCRCTGYYKIVEAIESASSKS